MPRMLQNPRIFWPLIVGLGLITYLLYYNSLDDKVMKLDLRDGGIPLTGEPPFGIKKPLIMIYTKVFGNDPIANNYLEGCPLKCQLTTDKRLFDDAHAVVFHAGDFKEHDLPKKKANPTQKWVFWTMETKEAGYLKQSQDGIDALKPDWIMDYSTSAHIPHYYGGFFVDPETATGKGYQPVANLTTEEILKDKQFRGAIGFISNCNSKERLNAVKAMSKYMRIDIGGACALNKSKKKLCPRKTDCTPIINWNYFYLALENMNCVDYVSEKFTDRLHLPVIPIVVSKRNYEHRFPKEAFIAMDDYKSAKELTDYLNYLMKHPSEYVKLFEWRKNWKRAPWNGAGYRNGVCGLCEKIMREGNKPTEPIQNINKWRDDHAPCIGKVLPDSWFQ